MEAHNEVSLQTQERSPDTVKMAGLMGQMYMSLFSPNKDAVIEKMLLSGVREELAKFILSAPEHLLRKC